MSIMHLNTACDHSQEHMHFCWITYGSGYCDVCEMEPQCHQESPDQDFQHHGLVGCVGEWKVARFGRGGGG